MSTPKHFTRTIILDRQRKVVSEEPMPKTPKGKRWAKAEIDHSLPDKAGHVTIVERFELREAVHE